MKKRQLRKRRRPSLEPIQEERIIFLKNIPGVQRKGENEGNNDSSEYVSAASGNLPNNLFDKEKSVSVVNPIENRLHTKSNKFLTVSDSKVDKKNVTDELVSNTLTTPTVTLVKDPEFDNVGGLIQGFHSENYNEIGSIFYNLENIRTSGENEFEEKYSVKIENEKSIEHTQKKKREELKEDLPINQKINKDTANKSQTIIFKEQLKNDDVQPLRIKTASIQVQENINKHPTNNISATSRQLNNLVSISKIASIQVPENIKKLPLINISATSRPLNNIVSIPTACVSQIGNEEIYIMGLKEGLLKNQDTNGETEDENPTVISKPQLDNAEVLPLKKSTTSIHLTKDTEVQPTNIYNQPNTIHLNNIFSTSKKISTSISTGNEEVYSLRLKRNLLKASTLKCSTPLQTENIGVHVEKNKIDLDFLVLLNKQPNSNILINFYKILRFILGHHNFQSVLYQEEKVFIYGLLQLPETYQFVCLKLFLSLPKWYSINPFLQHNNIELEPSEISKMAKMLSNKKLTITGCLEENASELLDLLNIDQVHEIYKELNFTKNIKKDKSYMINNLLIILHCDQMSQKFNLLKMLIIEKLGSCFKMSVEFRQILHRIHLIYSFTNEELSSPSNLYQFMDRIKFNEISLPVYIIDFTVQFKTKEVFKRYSLAREFYNQFTIAQEKNDREALEKITTTVCQKFKEIVETIGETCEEADSYLNAFSSGNLYAKILSKACDYFTKSYQLIAPILQVLINQNLYGRSYRADWMNRLANIYETHYKDNEMAAQIVMLTITSSLATHEIQEICETGKRLIKKKTNQASEDSIESLKLFLKDFKDCTDNIPIIETNEPSISMRDCENNVQNMNELQIALDYYRYQGFPSGICFESSLMINYYFLLFWDIIYKYHDGSFLCEIQYLPIDFYTKEFYLKRKHDIDYRLNNIETGWSMIELEVAIMATFKKEKKEYSSVLEMLGNHKIYDHLLLMEIINYLDRGILRNILYNLVIDFRHFSNELPDLFLWSNISRKCKFVEVKRGDEQLSLKKKYWLNYLKEMEADVEIFHINE